MKTSRFSEQQIAFVLRQAEEGTAVAEVCRKAGVATIRASHPRENDQTFRYAALFSGLDIVRKALRLADRYDRLHVCFESRTNGIWALSPNLSARPRMHGCRSGSDSETVG